MKVTLQSLGWSASMFALGFALGGCVAPPVESPKTTVEQQTDVATQQNLKDKVDLLFMIDDSGSMSPKATALKTRFPDLISVLNTFAAAGNAASYHIGVVTSDLGAPGISCGSNLGAKMQQRGLAKTNAAGCQGPVGQNYIVFDQKTMANNLPAGQDLPTTFNCMASGVDPDNTPGGHYGCGFEAQLESVYRALHDNIPENAGFLRDDAILAVVWVTDEDDCSVDPTSDLFGMNPAYGPLNSYRCAQFGIICDGMLLPSAPQASFQNCTPATPAQGGKLTDLTKYVNYFTQGKAKGGVKANPHDVVLAAITAPNAPVGSNGVSGAALCGSGVQTCTNISHSCVAADNPLFFGDPSQRLTYVVSKAQANQITSICDTDYKSALEGIGNKIVAALQPSCLTAPIKDPTKPDCVVEDVTTDANGVDQHHSIPLCANSGGAKPCWTAVQEAKCPKICNPTPPGCYQQFGVSIDRGMCNGAPCPAAPNTSAQVSCATIAIANEDPNAACVANAAQTGCM